MSLKYSLKKININTCKKQFNASAVLPGASETNVQRTNILIYVRRLV